MPDTEIRPPSPASSTSSVDVIVGAVFGALTLPLAIVRRAANASAVQAGRAAVTDPLLGIARLVPEPLHAGARISALSARGRREREAVVGVLDALLDDIVPYVIGEVLRRGHLAEHVVRYVDLDQVVASVDLDRAVAGVDINRIASRLDLDAVVGALDVDAVAAHLDVTAVVDRLDLTAIVLHNVDLETVLNAVLAQVDMIALAQEIIEGIGLTRAHPRVNGRDGFRRSWRPDAWYRRGSSDLSPAQRFPDRSSVAVRLPRGPALMTQSAISPIPQEARPYQGLRSGVVTRVAASTIDGLVVCATLLVCYAGVAGFLFPHQSAQLQPSSRRLALHPDLRLRRPGDVPVPVVVEQWQDVWVPGDGPEGGGSTGPHVGLAQGFGACGAVRPDPSGPVLVCGERAQQLIAGPPSGNSCGLRLAAPGRAAPEPAALTGQRVHAFWVTTHPDSRRHHRLLPRLRGRQREPDMADQREPTYESACEQASHSGFQARP